MTVKDAVDDANKWNKEHGEGNGYQYGDLLKKRN